MAGYHDETAPFRCARWTAAAQWLATPVIHLVIGLAISTSSPAVNRDGHR
jgi:hypothetical protein